MAEAESANSSYRLWELIWGCAIGQAIHVAVELQLPELLHERVRSADELARASESDAWALETVLRALHAFDLLQQHADERYELTNLGRLLLRSSGATFPGEAGHFFHTLYQPLGALLHMVKTGEVAFDHVYGESFYAHLQRRPALSCFFHDMMKQNAKARYAQLSSVVNFKPVKRVVDVGGSEGALLAQVLRENPHLNGVLFDLPDVIERAREQIAAAGLLDRCELIAGSFLDYVPAGGDIYLLAQIINNWADPDALRVLENCRAAMCADARLLVLEAVSTPGVAVLPWRALVSLGVMAQRGGRTRSEIQLRELFDASGFCFQQVHRLPESETCAIVGRLAL